MMLKPINDWIMARRIRPSEQVSETGLVLPRVAWDETLRGEAEVLAVGPGRVLPSGVRVSPSVKPGDRILFWEAGATDIDSSLLCKDCKKDENDEIIFLKEESIIVVLPSAQDEAGG
jgi:co-chaperonin GroES (HSP10)